MYRIGIVEDSGDEIDKIERTLDFFYTDFDMSYYFSDRTYTPENIVGNLQTISLWIFSPIKLMD